MLPELPPLPKAKKVYTTEEFEKMYLELCKLTGWQHAGVPAFKHSNDLGGDLITVQFVYVPYKEVL